MLDLVGGRTRTRTLDPLIKSQLFIRNRLFHASANTRPAVRDCVMMLEFFSRTERAVTEQTADLAHMTDKPAVKIEINAALNAQWKTLGGSDRDQWNDRLLATTLGVSERRYLVSGIKQKIRRAPMSRP